MDSIVKSVLFIAAGTPVLVITNGTTLIDTKKIAQHMGVSKNKVKLANAETVFEVTGYPIGGVPPVAHKTPVQVLIDQRVLDIKEVYGGGGTVETLLRITPQEIARVTQAQVISLID